MQGRVSAVANKDTLKGNALKEEVVTEAVAPPSGLSRGFALDARREIIGLGTVNQEKTLKDSLSFSQGYVGAHPKNGQQGP